MYPFRIRLADLWQNLWIWIGNQLRGRARRKLDYIVFDIQGSLPEFQPRPPWWLRLLPVPGLRRTGAAWSLSALREALKRVAADSRPRGVIFRLSQLSIGWSTAQSLRSALAQIREQGKEVVVYADHLDNVTYFVACAAERIILPPGATWDVLGLSIETFFLKDALDRIGVEADVVAVSPYKSAADFLRRSEMSPESRENLNLILDAQFGELVGAIAAGRNLDLDEVRSRIDGGPYLAGRALEAGLIDLVSYFDELPDQLSQNTAAEAPAQLISWSAANRILRKPIRWRSGRYVAVVPVHGTIVYGASRRSPVPLPIPLLSGAMAGSETVTSALRQAEQDPRIAAVVLSVDSRGGSSLASDLIWREVARLRRKKPVVAYFGNVAASGGYYVALDASWIVAQPLTLTGSIGVLWMKLVLEDLLQRAQIHRETLKRGQRAALYSDPRRLSESDLEAIKALVDGTYSEFKQRVVSGRGIEADKLEGIAGGRIWLGRQALERSLVDELGDLEYAVAKAVKLAELPGDRWTPTIWLPQGRPGMLPARFPAETLAELLNIPADPGGLWLISPIEFRIA